MSDADDLLGRVRRWLAAAHALWAERGLDERGLFFEQLGLDGAPERTSVRRVRVQGRQLFTAARAAAGGIAAAGAVLARALPAIRARAWAVDGAPGWIHTLAPDGAPLDLARDTYDQAFMLLGLAEAARLGVAGAEAAGSDTWAFVDTLRDARAGGYLEGWPATLPRRANPHMHLLEVALLWFDVTGDRAHLARADEIADLFERCFFDRERCTLREFFDEAWRPLPDALGRSVEPGHVFEWSWLLHELARAGGRDLRAPAAALHAWGCAHGRDAAGFAVDEVDCDGAVRRASRRAWPQTELIKSAVANGDLSLARAAAATFLDTYLATDVTGLWIDQFDAAGAPATGVVPASTFYHVVVAFEALLNAISKEAVLS